MSPFIRMTRCACCGYESLHVKAERQPDGSVRWFCQDIIACAHRKLGVVDDWHIYDSVWRH